MIAPAQKNLARKTVKQRQQEVKRCLAEFGLMPGPHRLSPSAGVSASEETHGRRLCAALRSLGPVFSLFGIYLSSRADLLPAEYCLELAAIPDRADVTPIDIIRKLLHEELGSSFDKADLMLDERPFDSRILFQSHHARLKDQPTVVVNVLHPEFEERLLRDSESLPILKAAFVGHPWGDFPFELALEGFNHMLRQRDFADHGKVIAALAEDASEFDMLEVSHVYHPSCSSKLLIMQPSVGLRLDELIRFLNGLHTDEQAAKARFETLGINAKTMARNLCLVWLRQAFLGRAFPVTPMASHIEIFSSRQVAFTGGSFASLPSDAKTHLWDYLISALNEDPDRACACLMQEMNKQKGVGNEDELRHQFRQLEPFRDSGWSGGGRGGHLSEVLFLHWRLASRQGYRPHSHLVCFYRGLFLIVATARRLSPASDSLREGLEQLRLIQTLKQFEEIISPYQLGSYLERYAAMMTELPQKLDAALTLAAEGNLRLKVQEGGKGERRRQKDALAIAIALMLFLGAVAVLSRHLAASGVAGLWVESASAILVVIIGVMLLRASSRAG